jgi:hypothetical protein
MKDEGRQAAEGYGKSAAGIASPRMKFQAATKRTDDLHPGVQANESAEKSSPPCKRRNPKLRYRARQILVVKASTVQDLIQEGEQDDADAETRTKGLPGWA